VPDDLEAAAHDVLRANEINDARMRITITSGSGPAGLARGAGSPTTLIATLPLTPWPPVSTAIVSRFRRDEHSPLAGIKTTSLAHGVIALAEARDAGADEALLLNIAGNLCEATTANVFLVHDGVAATTPLDAGCLAGITRAHVLELGAEERTLSPDDLLQAAEAFLTSSTREVQPLVAIDGRPVGVGQPGPVTLRLANAYSEMVAARLR
jgi:branched-chain amino acid aminotransferase